MISRTIPPHGPVSYRAGAHLARTSAVGESHTLIPGWKRALDITVVLLTSPAWLPLMILLTLWVKTVSRGPVFFRQKRIGYHGRVFMMLKFRSMKVNSETLSHEDHCEKLIKSNRPMTKLDATDKRIIFGGSVLRAIGLDELPQIFNVLRGEMSIVGPRPCLPGEYAYYDSRQRQRVVAPPGLTGYWQVNGKNNTTFNKMIDLDLEYSKRMCVLLDLWIIVLTVPALVGQLIQAKFRGPRAAAAQPSQGRDGR